METLYGGADWLVFLSESALHFVFCDLHWFLIYFQEQFNVMDNYSDNHKVLIELGLGYLKSHFSATPWQLRSTEALKLTTLWFRY